MKRFIFPIAGLAMVIGLMGCQSQARQATPEAQQVSSFKDYWYQGQAELTSYHLEQARYGEMHEGEAVLIFVTEPFSKSKQVKLDYGGRNPQDEVSVLKLNLTKKFNTGLYPYSIMQSTFTPITGELPTLKVSMSSQEWCGHTYSQLNYNADGSYHHSGKSYFESEGDVEEDLSVGLLEDGLWANIRINPENLPTGKFDMIPSATFSRLRHRALEPYAANGSLSEEQEGLRTYTVAYPKLKRTLAITFQTAFPHTIEGWTETMPSGFGLGAPLLTTRATLNKRIMSDYWNKNRPRDAAMREELGLD